MNEHTDIRKAMLEIGFKQNHHLLYALDRKDILTVGDFIKINIIEVFSHTRNVGKVTLEEMRRLKIALKEKNNAELLEDVNSALIKTFSGELDDYDFVATGDIQE